MDKMTILLPYDYHGGVSTSFSISDHKERSPLQIVDRILLKDAVKYICHTSKEQLIGNQHWIIDEHNEKTDMQIGAVIRTEAFEQAFFYNGLLGCTYCKSKTSFKLWAPTATTVQLKLFNNETGKTEIHQLVRKQQGVWQLTVHRDLERFYYTFLVCVNLEWREAVDPYAVSVSTNGKHGIIIDINKTKTIKPPLPPIEHLTDAIIYETHIRDFTIHPKSGITEKGTYLGVAELNTVGTDGNLTGLSYVKELGVTHIELLPVNDFEGVDEGGTKKDYNWGYNPLHFNTPEGSYSTNPADPYLRITELKTMIQMINSVGLRVILDVVYNHVYIREQSTFEKIVPGYYFRYDEFGMPSNGTGVGNDFASERLMARKFILDSVLFWMNEYNLDGFRFDLMGALDITTINQVRKLVDSIDPTTIIIGEGWDLQTPILQNEKANIRNQEKLPKIGQFNDWFRDTIKGSTFNLYDKGYALGNEHYYEAAKQVISGSIGIEKNGSLFCSPIQSVNYVESHDNHTLWDKLSVCLPVLAGDNIQRYHRLATIIVLLSQGVPFLHSGQEFFRTKYGIVDSYRSPNEINQLDWERKGRFTENVNYIKGIIAIRKAHRAFRINDSRMIHQHMKFLPLEKPIIGYLLDQVGDFGKWERILVFFNPTNYKHTVDLPEGIWDLIVDDKQAGIMKIRKIGENVINLEPISAYVLVSS